MGRNRNTCDEFKNKWSYTSVPLWLFEDDYYFHDTLLIS